MPISATANHANGFWGNPQGNVTWAGGSPVMPPAFPGTTHAMPWQTGMPQPWMPQQNWMAQHSFGMPAGLPPLPTESSGYSGGGGGGSSFGFAPSHFADGSRYNADGYRPDGRKKIDATAGPDLAHDNKATQFMNQQGPPTTAALPGSAAQANGQLQAWQQPKRMATGGFLPPGQTAIVGDNRYGSPGPNAEMIQALPGGGVAVAPNPANVPPPPKVYETQPDSMTGMRVSQPPPPIISQQTPPAMSPAAQALLKKNQPFWSGIIPQPVKDIAVPVWHGMEQAFGDMLYPQAIDSDYQKSLQRENAFVYKTGKSPYEPPVYNNNRPGEKLNPLPDNQAPWKGNSGERDNPLPENQAPWQDPGTKNNPLPSDNAPWKELPIGSKEKPMAGDYAPWQKAPPKAWDDRTMMAYLAAHNAGKSDEEANKYAESFAATPHDASPIQFDQPSGPRTPAQDNAILQRWQQDSSTLPPPPVGLSPANAAAYQEQVQRLSQTRAGRAQLMQGELDRNLGAVHDQRTQAAKAAFWGERHPTGVIQTETGPVQYFNGKPVPQPKQGAKIDPNAYQQDLGKGVIRVWDGKNWHINDPEVDSGAPILESQYHSVKARVAAEKNKAAVLAAKEPPLEPGLHQIPNTNYWQLVGKDHKVVTQFQGSPEEGFTPFDPKSAAKPAPASKEEKYNAYQVDPNTGKVTYLHHPPGHETPPGVMLLKPQEQQTIPGIKNIKKV
jgi:hypothetical protein